MKTTFLDFEQSVAELETKIEELRFVQDESSVDISDELKTLSEPQNPKTPYTWNTYISFKILYYSALFIIVQAFRLKIRVSIFWRY